MGSMSRRVVGIQDDARGCSAGLGSGLKGPGDRSADPAACCGQSGECGSWRVLMTPRSAAQSREISDDCADTRHRWPMQATAALNGVLWVSSSGGLRIASRYDRGGMGLALHPGVGIRC